MCARPAGPVALPRSSSNCVQGTAPRAPHSRRKIKCRFSIFSLDEATRRSGTSRLTLNPLGFPLPKLLAQHHLPDLTGACLGQRLFAEVDDARQLESAQPNFQKIE